MKTQSLWLISRGDTPDVKSTGMIGWVQKSAAKQVWLYFIHRTARPGYAGTSTDCFENPKNSLLKLNHPKNTCQIFLPPKNPGIKNLNAQKIPRSSPSLEIQSTPRGVDHQFIQVNYYSPELRCWAPGTGGRGGRWGTRLGQQNSKIYITCLRQDYLFYYPV